MSHPVRASVPSISDELGWKKLPTERTIYGVVDFFMSNFPGSNTYFCGHPRSLALELRDCEAWSGTATHKNRCSQINETGVGSLFTNK